LLACRPSLHPKGERLPVVSDFIIDPNQIGDKTTAASIKNKTSAPIVGLEPTREKLMSIRNLTVQFPATRNLFGRAASLITAVDNISFDVMSGETLGLVGESGCGKTTLGRALLRLIEPSSGSIHFKDRSLTTMKASELKMLRKDIQIIFQDPYSSLNPRLTIGDALTEPLKVHGMLRTKKERRERAAELLEKVNMNGDHLARYPHEFSGGQRQRLVIARALTLEPSFLVCDESVSALDVSVQAQVLNLLADLKTEYGFTIIFISHDLSVVHYISDRIMVMNHGRIEEIGDAGQVFKNPTSEYTRKLLESIPTL
ncbi:MAG: ABC transporter ATP-binding protein, partial [Chitinophagaceae bacterium]|nr:ABC transporter ATP-binding protein [Chitinophagaceae bacterium]